LGHIISADGIAADPAKLAAVQTWAYPHDLNGLQQFLGLANYFRQFCPNFSRIAVPLYHLCEKGVKFDTDVEACKIAFDLIKHMLINTPVLAFPDPECNYTLISDASMTGCGAVLTQNDKPVAYFSSKFSPAERNYHTTDQEMLGVIKALKTWRCYLEGNKPLLIVTDHSANTFFPRQTVLSGRQARWSDFLSRFNLVWKHTPGVDNPADGLSRLHCSVLTAAIQATLFELDPDLVDDFDGQYQFDAAYSDPDFIKQNKLALINGKYSTADHRVAVPGPLVTRIITAHHCTAFAGHRGVQGTIDLVKRNFWWPKLSHDVK
jgi:hypothetical protein